MSSLLPFIKSHVVICMAIVCAVLGGCSDEPNRAASRQANKAVAAALQVYERTGDFELAHKELAALSGESLQDEAAMLMKADLAYGRAGKMQTELVGSFRLIDSNIIVLNAQMQKIVQLQNEQAQIQSNLRAHEEELKALQSQLLGDNNSGLQAQLDQAKKELNELQEQRQGLVQKAKAATTQAAEIQKQSSEMLRKADSVSGDEKARLQQEAYSLLKGSAQTPGATAYMKDAQNIQDQIAVVDSDIAIAAPKVAKIEGAITTVQNRIDELSKSQMTDQAQQQLNEIAANTSTMEEGINAQFQQLIAAKEQLDKKFAQVTELLSDAKTGFARVRSDENINDLAKVASADAAFRAASAGADFGLRLKNAAARVAILPQTTGDMDAQKSRISEQFNADSVKIIDTALQDYNDASETYDTIRAGNNEFGTAVLKNHLLTLTQRAYLADKIENAQVMEQSLAKAKEVADKAVELNRTFINTPAAQFYYKFSGTTPPPPPVEPNADGEPNAEAATPTDVNTAVDPNAEDPNFMEVDPNVAGDEPNAT